MEWLESNQIRIAPPKHTRKITGTRLGAILGISPWATPFSAWCEITHTWEEPFKESQYTLAGKILEPRQRAFIASNDLIIGMTAPEDVYGPDPFKVTYGDFYHQIPVFGGMWDALDRDEDGNVLRVFEFKTTKRAEDWIDKDGNPSAPEHYKAQAFLYAYLLGVTSVSLVCTFLNPSDYPVPKPDGTFDRTPAEKVVCSANNTIRIDYDTTVDTLHTPYGDLLINDAVATAQEWWDTYVMTGISPAYDVKADAEILKALKTANVSPDDTLEDILRDYASHAGKVNKILALADEDTKAMKADEDKIKQLLQKAMGKDDKTATVAGEGFTFTLSRSVRETVNTGAMKADGVYQKYVKPAETFRLSKKEDK